MWILQWKRSHEFTEFHQCDCRQHFKQVYITQCITETLAVHHSKTLKIFVKLTVVSKMLGTVVQLHAQVTSIIFCMNRTCLCTQQRSRTTRQCCDQQFPPHQLHPASVPEVFWPARSRQSTMDNKKCQLSPSKPHRECCELGT